MHLNKIKPPSLTGNNLNEITKNKIGQANKLKRVFNPIKKNNSQTVKYLIDKLSTLSWIFKKPWIIVFLLKG